MPIKPKSNIPKEMEISFSQRDQSPMGADSFVKFQLISLMPGISKNFRFLIHSDGRLFYAENTKDQQKNRSIIFNQPIPEAPTRQLSDIEMAEIRDKINEVKFFEEPEYQSSKVKDGSLAILTIKEGDQIHEVWYANTHNVLTDMLHSLPPYEQKTLTPGQHLANLKKIAKDLKRQEPDK